MKHRWTHSPASESKYHRLFHAQQLIEISRLVMLLDRLEPITDLTQAQQYLTKFTLNG
jgi:hypothetical protein